MNRSAFVARGALAAGAFTTGMLIKTSPALSAQTIKFAFPDAATHPVAGVARNFKKNVEARTKGRLTVDIYPGGTIGSETNLVGGLQTGILDVSMSTGAYISSYVPNVAALDLPFIFKDKDAAQKILAGDVGKSLVDDMTSKNLLLLGWAQNGWRNIETVDKPIHAVGDVSGLKIRIQSSPVYAAMFKAIGAVPVVMDAGDLYLGLQQKSIEGLEVPISSFVAFKAYEVAKHIALTRHVYNVTAIVGSKPKLDAMTPDDREAVRSSGAQAAAEWLDLAAKMDRDALAFCVRNGTTVTEPDRNAFRTAMQPVYAQFKDRYGAIVPKLLAAATA
jgi:tripartite ATP-independent transporter DctP family solute receptor